MALSKKDLQINITLNELYNTHSLLMQHMDVLVSASASAAWGRFVVWIGRVVPVRRVARR
jgi:hypothetical protein